LNDRQRSKLGAWLQLLRVPNLFTVPGDPLVGFIFARLFLEDARLLNALFCIAAALLLYSGGLILNDLFDLKEDRRDRPTRPLAAGEISLRAAWIAAVVCVVAGISLAFAAGAVAGIVAVCLTAAILTYNAGIKRIPALGPINMGLCRALSLMMGAVSVSAEALTLSHTLVPAIGLGLYIAAVTNIASGETRPGTLGAKRLGPPVAILIWLAGLNTSSYMFFILCTPAAVLQILAAGWVLACCAALRRPSPKLVQQTVGRLIRTVLLVQASVAAILLSSEEPTGWIAVALLLVFWPASAILARRFYAS